MKYRILIVEDDPAIAGAVKRQIEAWGCEARTAENFADVTADFRSFAPHLEKVWSPSANPAITSAKI